MCVCVYVCVREREGESEREREGEIEREGERERERESMCVFVYEQQIKILKNKKKVLLVYGLRNVSHRQTHTHFSDEHILALLTSRQRSVKIWPISWQTSLAPCLKYF